MMDTVFGVPVPVGVTASPFKGDAVRLVVQLADGRYYGVIVRDASRARESLTMLARKMRE